MLQEVHHYIEIDKSSYVINGLVIDTDKFILCVLIKGVYWTSLTKLFQRKIGCMVIQHRKDWMNKILWVLCYIQSKSTHLKFLWFYSITNAEKIMEILKKSWCATLFLLGTRTLSVYWCWMKFISSLETGVCFAYVCKYLQLGSY